MTDRAKGNLHDWVRTGFTVLALVWAGAMLVANVRQHSQDIEQLNTVTLRLSQTVTDLAMNDATTKAELMAVRREIDRLDRATERTP